MAAISCWKTGHRSLYPEAGKTRYCASWQDDLIPMSDVASSPPNHSISRYRTSNWPAICTSTDKMPEGPSLFLLKEDIIRFRGKRVKEAEGNAGIDIQLLTGKTLKEIRTWGKQLFLLFSGKLTVRIHLLMFGSYSVDEKLRPKRSIRLQLRFATGTIYFYTCAVRMLEPGWEDGYDWSADIMSEQWNARGARKKLRENPEMLACDALLDQQIFSGSGNIIKNEVLFRIFLHPESKIGKIPPSVMTALIRETHKYSFDFLKWKRNHELKKHWLIIGKKICPRCNVPVAKKYLGKTKRRTFFCHNCQEKYV